MFRIVLHAGRHTPSGGVVSVGSGPRARRRVIRQRPIHIIHIIRLLVPVTQVCRVKVTVESRVGHEVRLTGAE